MDNNFDNLKRLFDQLKSIGLWGRIFKWKSIKNLMIDAAGDLNKLQMNVESLSIENSEFKSKFQIAEAGLETKQKRITELDSDLRSLTEKHDELFRKQTELAENTGTNLQSITELSDRKIELERELADIKKDYKKSQDDLVEANNKVVQFESTEESRILMHSNNASTLKEIHTM
jgi:chromosome segregation ATPase